MVRAIEYWLPMPVPVPVPVPVSVSVSVSVLVQGSRKYVFLICFLHINSKNSQLLST